MSDLRKVAQMSNREVMQQALDALEELDGLDTETECVTIDVGDVMDALRAALEQQAEPVAWIRPSGRAMLKTGGYCTVYASDGMSNHSNPLYTTPPQRQWVGLTDEDFLEACQIAERGNYLLALQRIQIKLKEKNSD